MEINIFNCCFYIIISYIILIHTLSLSLIPSSVRVPDSPHLPSLRGWTVRRFITLVALYILIIKIKYENYILVRYSYQQQWIKKKQITGLKLKLSFGVSTYVAAASLCTWCNFNTQLTFSFTQDTNVSFLGESCASFDSTSSLCGLSMSRNKLLSQILLIFLMRAARLNISACDYR